MISLSGPLLQGGVIATFLVLGALWPRGSQPLVGRHTAVNLGTGLLMLVVRVAAVSQVDARLQLGLVDLTGAPGPVQLLLAFLALDLTRYWVHRLDHRLPWLWTFHRVHHSTRRLDATAGLRMHIVDFLQLSAIPILLFSVLLAVEPWVFAVAMGIGVVADGWQHANLRVDLDRPLWRAWDRLLNNPHFHAWHHNADGALCDGNYGNTLTVWDRLFGSDVSQPVLPAALGLSADQDLEESIVGLQLLRPSAASRVNAPQGASG